MNYVSLCSGIESATSAWHNLPGFNPVAFSEIDKHASSVLAYHYPAVPNLGDMTLIDGDEYRDRIDLAVAGTPCQGFSVAGLRRGLADDRSNLCLSFVKFVLASRPRWLLWENVPGVFSSKGGEDFSCFLSALSGVDVPAPGEGWRNSGVVIGAEGFYSLAWRVLDAQHFGVPQRRRRVFVVGYLGDWRRAAAVLFERHSLSGHPPPSREKRQTAPTISSRRTAGGGLGTYFDCDGGLDESPKQWPAEIGSTLNAHYGDKWGLEDQHALGGAALFVASSTAHSLRADGFDASEDRTGRGTPLVPVMLCQNGSDIQVSDISSAITSGISHQTSGPLLAFNSKDYGANVGDTSPTLRAMGHDRSCANAGGQVAVAMNLRGREGGAMPEMDTLASIRAASGGSSRSCLAIGLDPQLNGEEELIGPLNIGSATGGGQPARVSQGMAVRRLTPRECARLQGFPDDYLAIPVNNKIIADGPQYKMLGNSMAVPCMRWIGQRIKIVDDLVSKLDLPR